MHGSFQAALEQLQMQGRFRRLTELEQAPSRHVIREGRQCLNFSSNNYLDIANHPKILAAAHSALDISGASAGGSRLLGGNLPVHGQLETDIANFCGTESALLFNTGFQANASILPALGEVFGPILADQQVHASAIEGMRLASQGFHRFRHGNWDHLRDLLLKVQGQCVVITESLYSMDGDMSDHTILGALQKEFGFFWLIDEAHSVAAIPALHAEIMSAGMPSRMAFMGTFGKALGGFGAYVAGSSEMVAYLTSTARGFIFSTALPPAIVAGNRAALEIVQDEGEFWRAERLAENGTYLRNRLREEAFDIGISSAHIIPIMVGPSDKSMLLSFALFDYGIHAPAIRPPTVREGKARLRISLQSAFEKSELDHLVNALLEIRASNP